jgi:hypothetical protein
MLSTGEIPYTPIKKIMTTVQLTKKTLPEAKNKECCIRNDIPSSSRCHS